MIRVLAPGIILALSLANSASAATCPSNPYTFTNGTTADATQLMGNFNNLLTCANSSLAPLASPSFTGNVGIGTTSPANNLDVESPTQYHGLVVGNGASLSAQLVGLNVGNDNGGLVLNSGGTKYVQIVASGTSFITGGNVGIGMTSPIYLFQVNGSAAGNTAWTNLSDERLKKDIAPIDNALGLVKRLRGVHFHWRPADERSIGKNLTLPKTQQIGFIAQEVAAVVPEAVIAPKKGAGLYGLKESDLVPVLVQAIKEQQAQIEQQQAEIEQLRMSFTALKAGK